MLKTNHVQLIGSLGADVEVKTINDKEIVTFSIATKSFYKKGDEKVENVEWHKIVSFGFVAEICKNALKKGTSVILQGHLQTRKYENKDKQICYSTEIVCDEILVTKKP